MAVNSSSADVHGSDDVTIEAVRPGASGSRLGQAGGVYWKSERDTKRQEVQ